MALDQFTHSLPMMLYRTLDAVMPRFRKIFNDFDLTEQQWRVLRVLWETDHTTIMELSEATLLPAPSLVGIVDRLERDQLVNEMDVRIDEPGHDREAVGVDHASARRHGDLALPADGDDLVSPNQHDGVGERWPP